ncbi:hypothetical protein L1987_02366 [Smallanthus sonchifolius]|uniref:Uncharacterized protein n=1 Tax=Smallanthus sonchifolius TaxID=185202 RepID=A0ACB9K7Q4_9ASTR|nr:hypothetical protein L1987_02366 [Smallanthus sonchifolius]
MIFTYLHFSFSFFHSGSSAIIKLQTLIRRRSIREIQLQTLSRSIGLNSRNPKNEEPVVEDDDDDNEEDDVEGETICFKCIKL